MTPTRTTPDRLDRPAGDPLFERLFPPLPTGVHWGLERVEAALRALGDPHRAYDSIHVGGTNGKGSVSATIHAVLDRHAGVGPLRAGLYTSPHLCSVAERFQIGGAPVATGRLIERADAIRDVVVEHGLTFFEAMTVLAFDLFQAEGADLVVAEVGLGGRLDATNVLRPLVAAVTNVAMDHADYLGDTLEAIAREKAGILEPGVPAVIAESDPDLVEVFRRRAEEVGCPLVRVHPDDVRDVEIDPHGTRFVFRTGRWGELELRTPLVGRHQATNAALAVRVLEELPERLALDAWTVREGLSTVRWPGRDQVEVVGGVTWLLDVAHNEAGVASLVDTLDRLELPAPRSAIVAVLGDKEWDRMLPPIFARCERVWLTQPATAPLGRLWDPEAVLAELRPAAAETGCDVRVVVPFDAAFEAAGSSASGGTVVVTGSVYTVGGALRALGRDPWSTEDREAP